MAKKIRVYELARELGLQNKEALDLCIALGIGVKSHSSSIEDQQADRVRRKAEREGLRRDVQPPEPTADADPGAAVADGALVGVPGERLPSSGERPSVPERPPLSGERQTAERAGAGGRLVTSRPSDGPTVPTVERPQRQSGDRPIAVQPADTPAARLDAPVTPPDQVGGPPAAPAAVPPGVRPATARPPAAPAAVPPGVRPAPPRPSSGPAAPRPPDGVPGPPAQASRPAAADAQPPVAPARPRQAPPVKPPVKRPVAPPPGGGQLLSPSGKPIPPPPGTGAAPPRSMSGKPIPPPPGRGPGQRPPAGASRPAAPASRPSGPGSRPGGGFSGPRTGGAGGFSRPGGPAAGGTGFGGRPGGPPGAGGGRPPFGGGPRGNQGRRRRPGRRRRNLEELEAQELTTYTPSNAPVPEGEVIVERGSTAQELGPKLNRSGADVVRFLFQQGEMVTATQSLTDDMIELFAAELGAGIRLVDPGEEKEAELQAKYFDDEEEDEALLRPRPPVVTVMGHVDHGKTMLLDRIRQSNVVAGEAGGITQHIGAYQVDYHGRTVTFIDTPGHEAFTAMRARGAEVTDIVILVVAADDGVMPQTVEALNHAKAADVPIIVAINKIDRDDADPNRVMQQLADQGLVPESWSGDTIMVEISALQDFGIDDLLEQVLLVAELEELVANPEGRARGVVLEANLDAGRGPVATAIVQNGTLRVGDSVVAGAAWGKVKALIDDSGDNVKEAPPSTPVQVLGFDSVPAAGDDIRVTDKGRTARDIAEQREQRYRAANLGRSSSATGSGARLEDIFEQIQRGETATLNLVLKADVQGSLEAVTESLRKLERDEVKLSFVHRAVGGITENDVTLAAASNATIIGFNVRPDRKARDLAEAQDVEIRTYEIIYKLIEEIESAMVGMLAPEYEEIITGEAEVREVFRVPRVGAVAGCHVRSGNITRGSKVRFLRDGVIIWKGVITSLRRFKDDVREVSAGFDCGIGLSNNQDLREGDIIETFDEREIPRS
ncbi:MAG TPA: translation initiation factor IF-2 [Acidimicrobiales bacterium]|nr:translation initiation factor IF-2 [Acidimicrobiales bacterium]